MSENDKNNNLSDEDKIGRRDGWRSGRRFILNKMAVGRSKEIGFWRSSLCCCCCCFPLKKKNSVAAETIAETGNGYTVPLKLFTPSEIPEKESFRKIAEAEDGYLTGPKEPEPKKPGNGFSGTSAAFLPTIRSNRTETERQKSSRRSEARKVDGGKYQEKMTQPSGFASNSREEAKKDSAVEGIRNNPSVGKFTVGGAGEPEVSVSGRRIMDRRLTKSHEILPTGVASAPAVVKTQDLTSAGNGDFVGSDVTGNDSRIGRLANGSEITGRIPYRNYNTCNPERRVKRSTPSRSANKMGIGSSPFPEILKPFDRPKECLETCLNQLESQQWEVNMLGLTSLLRLLKHHPAILVGQVHSIVVALARQIRNLRSQVTRAACQVSAELFLALKRNVEPDLDELAGPLFHRSADTNRFIRADCNDALDKMVDSVGHAKGVAVIISKGTTHQNATVRTVAARLLLRLSERVGPEKMLSLPKEIRDRMLQAGANLLTEGKLETRAFAKQVFRVWSSHSSFSGLLLEAISPNVLRQINKTLISLKS